MTELSIGVVMSLEHGDKLAKIVGIDGIKVAKMYPVYEVTDPDTGAVRRFDNFEKAAEVFLFMAQQQAKDEAAQNGSGNP